MSRTILIVEENGSRRDGLKAMLAGRFDVLEAPTTDTAIALLRPNGVDVQCILLSLCCEGAFDFLSLRRADAALHSIPVVAMLDATQPDAEAQALSLDVSDLLYFPPQASALLLRLQNLIRLRENMNLRKALERDPLTGIFNRHTFDRRTAKMLRKKNHEIYQLMVWDVEHFKVVNDLFGSSAGDRVLRAIGRYLDEQLRGVGTYARLDSDRFALCYPARLYEPRELVDGANRRLEDLNLGIRVVLYAGVLILKTLR